MKKALLFAIGLLIGISLFGCTGIGKQEPRLENENQKAVESLQNGEAEKKEVEAVVKNFGKQLQMVSLQAPKDVLKKSMQENYGSFVSQTLIEKWVNDPLNAPGRLTSSPWPDRIEITNTKKISENSYEVKGEIIEITSVEKAKDAAAAKRPITLVVNKISNQWLINDVTLGNYE